MPRQILTSVQARRLLAQYRASHLSQTAFCRKHTVSPGLFSYWQPKLFPALISSASQPSFQELRLKAIPSTPEACVITLPSGVRLEFPTAQLTAALAALLEGKAAC
jgi:hypothetical protein